MTAHTLDTRYLMCPLPVIRTQQCVENLGHGDLLEVIATDPGALNDIPAWCRVHGHEVLASAQTEHEVKVTLRVHKAPADS